MEQQKQDLFDHAQNISEFGKKVNQGYWHFLKKTVWPFYKGWVFSALIYLISSSVYLYIYQKAGFEPAIILMLSAVIMYSIRDASVYSAKVEGK